MAGPGLNWEKSWAPPVKGWLEEESRSMPRPMLEASAGLKGRAGEGEWLFFM